jgi:hypothetical protein
MKKEEIKEQKSKKEVTPEELINEGLGNKEKFQSENFREKIEGEIDEEGIESIEKAENEEKKKG